MPISNKFQLGKNSIVICCFLMVHTYFSPKYELKYNILVFLIMAPPLKNCSWPRGHNSRQYSKLFYYRFVAFRRINFTLIVQVILRNFKTKFVSQGTEPDLLSKPDSKPKLSAIRRKASGAKAYNCRYCGKSYGSANGLWYHIREHEGKYKYKCSYCDKAFNRKDQYEMHISFHEGRGYCCMKCKKIFRVESQLKKHQTTCN